MMLPDLGEKAECPHKYNLCYHAVLICKDVVERPRERIHEDSHSTHRQYFRCPRNGPHR